MTRSGWLGRRPVTLTPKRHSRRKERAARKLRFVHHRLRATGTAASSPRTHRRRGEILGVGSAPSVAPAIRPWDPARYRDPEAFDISRTDGGNLALGHGIHHCLGAPLARMEARIAFAALHTRFPAMRLAVDPAEPGWGHGAGLVLRGLSELPVVPGG